MIASAWHGAARAYVSRLDLTIAVYIMSVSTCRRQRKNPWIRSMPMIEK